jgi:hypothetical protein
VGAYLLCAFSPRERADYIGCCALENLRHLADEARRISELANEVGSAAIAIESFMV